MITNYQHLAAERAAECGERAAYFDSRLRFFSRTNWLTVIIPSLLGVIAGLALFSSTHSIWMGFWLQHCWALFTRGWIVMSIKPNVVG